jgi:hypothetical protein
LGFGLLKGFFGGVISTIETHELSTHTRFRKVINLDLIGDLVFFDLNLVLRKDLLGGFGNLPVDTYMTLLTGLGGDVARFVIAYAPKVFVDSHNLSE